MDVKAFTQAYRDELKGLNEADKATINMLTMLAEDNKQHAQAIVETIELHLREVCGLGCRLSVLVFCCCCSAAVAGLLCPPPCLVSSSLLTSACM